MSTGGCKVGAGVTWGATQAGVSDLIPRFWGGYIFFGLHVFKMHGLSWYFVYFTYLVFLVIPLNHICILDISFSFFNHFVHSQYVLLRFPLRMLHKLLVKETLVKLTQNLDYTWKIEQEKCELWIWLSGSLTTHLKLVHTKYQLNPSILKTCKPKNVYNLGIKSLTSENTTPKPVKETISFKVSVGLTFRTK